MKKQCTCSQEKTVHRIFYRNAETEKVSVCLSCQKAHPIKQPQ